MVEDAARRQAKPLLGGSRPEKKELERGHFYQPTLLKNVDYDAMMAKEKCFGPALPIFVVKDLQEALERANDTIYGLGSSIWTRTSKRSTGRRRESEPGPPGSTHRP